MEEHVSESYRKLSTTHCGMPRPVGWYLPPIRRLMSLKSRYLIMASVLIRWLRMNSVTAWKIWKTVYGYGGYSLRQPQKRSFIEITIPLLKEKIMKILLVDDIRWSDWDWKVETVRQLKYLAVNGKEGVEQKLCRTSGCDYHGYRHAWDEWDWSDTDHFKEWPEAKILILTSYLIMKNLSCFDAGPRVKTSMLKKFSVLSKSGQGDGWNRGQQESGVPL